MAGSYRHDDLPTSSAGRESQAPDAAYAPGVPEDAEAAAARSALNSPIEMRGCLTVSLKIAGIIAFTVAAVLIAQSMVPDEPALARTELPGGTVRFVFQSRHTAVAWPVGAGAAVVFIVLMTLLGRRGKREEAETLPLPEEKPRRRPRNIRSCLVLGLLAIPLALVLGKFVLFDPLVYFRAIEVGPDHVVMESLYSRGPVPSGDVIGTVIERIDEQNEDSRQTRIRYLIHCADGRMYSSVRLRVDPGTADMLKQTGFFWDTDAEVRYRLGLTLPRHTGPARRDDHRDSRRP